MSEQLNEQQTESQRRENPSRYNVSAKFYDLEYGQLTGAEREFYLELANQQDGPVLELGCGTGRVALELARAGHRVTGLDLSEHMLQEFKRKLAAESNDVQSHVTLVEGSMADFSFDQKFSLITVPFRAFQHLLTVEQQQNCLGLVREHLADGGLFVFDAFNPSLQYIVRAMQRSDTWVEDTVCQLPNGGQVRRSNRARHNPASQLLQLTWRYEEYDLQGRLIGTELEEMELRWLYRYEAEHLFRLCGLEVVNAYGGYDKRVLDDHANELIYVLRRAE